MSKFDRYAKLLFGQTPQQTGSSSNLQQLSSPTSKPSLQPNVLSVNASDKSIISLKNNNILIRSTT